MVRLLGCGGKNAGNKKPGGESRDRVLLDPGELPRQNRAARRFALLAAFGCLEVLQIRQDEHAGDPIDGGPTLAQRNRVNTATNSLPHRPATRPRSRTVPPWPARIRAPPVRPAFSMSPHSPHSPELLAPAGSLKNMRYAFAYGADAVYAGQPRYSLRVRNNEFDHANLALGINEAHALGKQFYVVVNIAPHNAKLKTFIKDLEPVVAMGPDALIMSAPGLIMLVREPFPHMHIHLSVQANAVNWASVEFWHRQGLTRAILSRELSLEEIGEIREKVPGMELEGFVHGALCMAYSGRCLLSGYINKRDPNQGTCTNACRWEYKAEQAGENEPGEVVQIVEPTLGG